MIIQERRNRWTKTLIQVVDNRDHSFDADDENGWFTVCDDHGNFCSHPTRRLAEAHATAPEWCGLCQVLMRARVDQPRFAGYVTRIVAEIHGDMRQPFPWGKQIPRDVGSFSALHDYCDANEYILQVMGDAKALDFSEEGSALVNAVLEEVDDRLAAEAASIRRGECVIHEYTDDTAIRVCVTHYPDFGLNADEVCEGGNQS
jgi:hypothetical protein